MKLFSGLMSILIMSASIAHAQESQARAGYYDNVLAAIQNSTWKGTFNSVAGLTACYGTLDVKFFPMQTEPFSGGVPTVSYRHHVQYSPLNPFFVICQTIGKALSEVDVGSCGANFPRKPTMENGRNVMVPFRTIIPKNGGSRAVISTPYCYRETGPDGKSHSAVDRLEFEVKRLEFTDIRMRDAMKMTIRVDAEGLPLMILNYDLKRVGQ
jgi:hypothetical protein